MGVIVKKLITPYQTIARQCFALLGVMGCILFIETLIIKVNEHAFFSLRKVYKLITPNTPNTLNRYNITKNQILIK